MFKILLIGLGGFLGAIARYGLVQLIQPLFSQLPGGILLTNITGSLLIGVFMSIFLHMDKDFGLIQPFLIIGFLGSFTTMATFAYDTVQLFSLASAGLALINVLLTLIFCFLGVYLGKQLGVLFTG